MIAPKTFYRKLDSLMTQIRRESGDGDFLPSIMKALEATFGADLSIQNGRLYQESVDSFLLVAESNPARQPRPAKRIPIDTSAIQEVLRHGSYIYADTAVGDEFGRAAVDEAYSIPIAFAVVRGPSVRWIFVYDLMSGWVREEVDLCMNAVRAALNYQLHAETIQGNLEQAAVIQRSLLPAEAPVLEGFELAGRSQPAELVGGDLYDFLLFEDATFGVSIGDASGHGLPAALLVRDVVTGLRMGMEGQMKMAYTLRKLNQVIHRSTFSTRFASLFYGEVEANGNLIYVNAGHPPPLLIRGDRVQQLQATGMVIGPLPELPLRRAYAFFEPGAVLVLYTDGIFERSTPARGAFGLERLTALVTAHQHLPAPDLVDLIFDAVFSFGNEEDWEDDATLVVVKRTDA